MTRFSTNLRLNIIRREPNLGPPRFPGRNQKGQSTSGPATKAIRCSPPFFAAPGVLKRKRSRRKGSEPEPLYSPPLRADRHPYGLAGTLPSARRRFDNGLLHYDKCPCCDHQIT